MTTTRTKREGRSRIFSRLAGPASHSQLRLLSLHLVGSRARRSEPARSPVTKWPRNEGNEVSGTSGGTSRALRTGPRARPRAPEVRAQPPPSLESEGFEAPFPAWSDGGVSWPVLLVFPELS